MPAGASASVPIVLAMSHRRISLVRAPRERAWPQYTMAEVARHRTYDDCWIVVHDNVYDMTPHCKSHEGWVNGSKQSTLLAILSAMGSDCTLDFDEVHSAHAQQQLRHFQIGVLDQPSSGSGRVMFRSWADLKATGAVPADG